MAGPYLGDPDPPENVTMAAPTGEDDTAAIMAQIQGVPNGSTVNFPAGARYLVNETLLVSDRAALSLVSDPLDPAVFYATENGPIDGTGESKRSHWRFNRCTDMTIRGLRVESTNTVEGDKPGYAAYLAAYEAEHGFTFNSCADTVIDQCSAHGVWGDGIYVGQGESLRLTISDFTVSWNGRQGIALTHCEGILIDGLTVANSRRGGVDCEPNVTTHWVRDVEIRNSTFTCHLLPFPAKGRGSVDNIWIHDNTITTGRVPVIDMRASDLTRRYDWTLEDNDFQAILGSPAAGIRFEVAERVIIRRNTLSFQEYREMAAVGLGGACADVTITDNVFDGAGSVVETYDEGASTYTESGNTLAT